MHKVCIFGSEGDLRSANVMGHVSHSALCSKALLKGYKVFLKVPKIFVRVPQSFQEFLKELKRKEKRRAKE